MKNINKKIINCINNENGGPNLEVLIGIGASISVFCAIQIIKDGVNNFVANLLTSTANLWNV